LRNSALVVFQYPIGSVFSQNIYPNVVNGSLWTLAPEFICYLGLLLVAILSRRNLKVQFVLITLALVTSAAIWNETHASSNGIFSTILNPASGLAVAFCSGSLLAILVEFWPVRPKPMPVIAGLVCWVAIGANGPVAIILLSALVVGLGMSLTQVKLSNIGRNVDISYGVYLYHFPLIQTVLATTTYVWTVEQAATILPLFIFVIAGSLAWMSWRFVEKPSIRIGRKLAIR